MSNIESGLGLIANISSNSYVLPSATHKNNKKQVTSFGN